MSNSSTTWCCVRAFCIYIYLYTFCVCILCSFIKQQDGDEKYASAVEEEKLRESHERRTISKTMDEKKYQIQTQK